MKHQQVFSFIILALLINSQTLKTHYIVDNQLINIFNVFLKLQANKYLSQKACRYGWKTG